MVFFLDYFSVVPISNFNILLIVVTSITGVLFSIPILYLVFLERDSTGSIDNASGVSILIELAKNFKKNPLKNMDLLIIWTGAEEWGLVGAKKFCKKHFNNLNQSYDLDRSYNINIDMVGSYIGLLYKHGVIMKRNLNHNLNDILVETAKKINIPMEKFNKTIKPKSDYKVFRNYARRCKTKLQVSFFHSDKDSKHIHSINDTPDKCSLDNLNGCLNICEKALRSIDLRI
jgi:Zn-dependent M28 family amino/carboxypeptidase